MVFLTIESVLLVFLIWPNCKTRKSFCDIIPRAKALRKIRDVLFGTFCRIFRYLFHYYGGPQGQYKNAKMITNISKLAQESIT